MKKARIGIIGLGRLGRKHAENLRFRIPEAELVAVCSLVEEELEAARRDLDAAQATRDYREILANRELDGVVIASTSQEHCRMICEAAQAGQRHVFCEKPLGMSREEISLIRRSAAAHPGLALQVGYNRRFDASIRAAKKKLDQGFVGRIIQIRMVNRDPASMADFIIKFSPRSGGLVMDMLTHDYDCARWFAGAEARSVYGLGGAFVYEGLEAVGDIDNCALLVEFQNGIIGQFETSRNSAYGYHVETEIYGSKGCIRIGAMPSRDRVTYFDAAGARSECAAWFFEYWESTFREEMQHFVQCCLSDGRPLVGLEDGCRAVEWALAAAEAVRSRSVVTVN